MNQTTVSRNTPTWAFSLLIIVAASVMTPLVTSAQAVNSGDQVYYTRFRQAATEGIQEVDIEGRVKFYDDGSGIAWMGENSQVRIVSRENGQEMRFEALPGEQGRPEFTFHRDHQAQKSAATADQWLASTLPTVFRELAFDVDARVEIAYQEAGAQGVYDLFADIQSPYSGSQHYAAFLRRPELTDEEIIGALNQLGKDVGTDTELASVLFATASQYRDRPAIRGTFVACLDHFKSPIEKSRVTETLFGAPDISAQMIPTKIQVMDGC